MISHGLIFGFVRDIIKALYLCSIQIVTRLLYIERKWPSSISFSSVLDVIPRRKHHELNRLVIGKRAFLEKRCVVNTWHGDVILGENSGVGIGSIILGPVKIGDHCHISQNCLVTGQSHRYEDVSRSFMAQGFDIKDVEIESFVWIGSNAVVLPGVRIGRNSVIGAGSVVTKDVPQFSVVVGNPAKVIRKYDPVSHKWFDLRKIEKKL